MKPLRLTAIFIIVCSFLALLIAAYSAYIDNTGIIGFLKQGVIGFVLLSIGLSTFYRKSK